MFDGQLILIDGHRDSTVLSKETGAFDGETISISSINGTVSNSMLSSLAEETYELFFLKC